MTDVASRQPAFVTAAKLAGRLHGVLATAKQISLSASNAKGIAARGGEKTAGFRPITDFISEMASDTISLVSQINQAALQISIMSVNEMRTVHARGYFSKAWENLFGQGREKQLLRAIDELDVQISGFQSEERKAMASLVGLFDDIDQRTRAAKIIVTNSRTEASRAGEFQTYLESIADSVERAAESIHAEIRVCRGYLSDLMKTLSVS